MAARKVFSIPLLALLLLVCPCIWAASTASAAELPLPERCIANGLTDFQDTSGVTFNHHPEKQREPRSTDDFLTAMETDTTFEALIADLPGPCRGSYHREGSIQLQYKTTKHGWRSLYKGWTPLIWSTHDLYDRSRSRDSGPDYFPDEEFGRGEVEYVPKSAFADEGIPSPWVHTGAHQNANTLGQGCTIGSRARIRLLVVDDRTSAIVAARLYTFPIQVESWYLARCLRKFSLETQAHAKSCPQRAIGGGPSLWRIKVKRIGCAEARAVGQQALQVPAFSEGVATPQRVGAWDCFYALRGAVACKRGRQTVYAQARGGTGEKCDRSAVPAGVKSLKALGVPCSTAAALAGATLAEPGTPSPVQKEAGGVAWSCASRSYFEYDDRMLRSYNCFSGEAAVSFRFPKPKHRLVPTEQTTMPAGVVFPGQGNRELFTITPEITFSEHAKWTKSKILLPFTVEAALVGQRARLEVETLTAKCEWTSDEGQTSPICPSTRRVGPGKRRTIVLQASQTINVGRPRQRGNWVYRLRISTPAFSLNSLDYRKTSHTLSFWMVNAATHCERNPWCHRD